MRRPVEIGDVRFTQDRWTDATRLWIEMVTDRVLTSWTVTEAKAAVVYLQQWIAEQEERY
jgi:hypothetical protein